MSIIIKHDEQSGATWHTCESCGAECDENGKRIDDSPAYEPIGPQMNAETLKELLANTTLGPWRVFGRMTGKIISENAPGIVEIGEIGDFRDPDLIPYNSDRWNADARLIALAPQLAAENIALQARLDAFMAGARKVLPLMEAAGREEVTDCADWDEAETMLRAALNGRSEA